MLYVTTSRDFPVILHGIPRAFSLFTASSMRDVLALRLTDVDVNVNINVDGCTVYTTLLPIL